MNRLLNAKITKPAFFFTLFITDCENNGIILDEIKLLKLGNSNNIHL